MSSRSDISTPASQSKGTPALGSYAVNNFDNVNLYNGNLSLTFPLAGKSGRAGTGFSVLVSRNSKLWQIETRQLPGSEDLILVPVRKELNDDQAPSLAVGWLLQSGRLVGRQSGWGRIERQCGGSRSFQREFTMTTLTFILPDGSEIDMRDQRWNGKPLSTENCQGMSRGNLFVSTDGSAATFVSHDLTTGPRSKSLTVRDSPAATPSFCIRAERCCCATARASRLTGARSSGNKTATETWSAIGISRIPPCFRKSSTASTA